MAGTRAATKIEIEGDCVVASTGRQSMRVKLDDIVEVAFYKRDEITTDLVVCEIISAPGVVWSLHEEMPGFDKLLDFLGRLPGFDADWPAKVISPAFARNRTIAFLRSVKTAATA